MQPPDAPDGETPFGTRTGPLASDPMPIALTPHGEQMLRDWLWSQRIAPPAGPLCLVTGV